jgi:hypothetical protein
LPLPRQYHTAVIYKTWVAADLNNLCPGNGCGPFCGTSDASCFVNNRNPSDGTAGGRGDLPVVQGANSPLPQSNSDCPQNCCNVLDEKCLRTKDITGLDVEIEEEVFILYQIMLVFGGITYRKKTNSDGTFMFNNCVQSHILCRFIA